MPLQDAWIPAEPSWESVLEEYPNPIQALAEMRAPAVIIRQAYNPTHCAGLIRRFIGKGLMPDQTTINADASAVPPRRIDIGTSLGNLGNSQAHFFEHAEQTHFLFRNLFDGFNNPVSTIYEGLARLAPDKRVMTAREPDGRLYGPAIFRIHYGGYAYAPHFDSVRWRENRVNYEVYRFEHQLAGLICFQNSAGLSLSKSEIEGESAQAILHRCLWTPEINAHIREGTFHQYAAENHIENVRVDLDPGDLYFFNTRCIHEVPGVKGQAPRIVLAVFIGYSSDDADVFVWS